MRPGPGMVGPWSAGDGRQMVLRKQALSGLAMLTTPFPRANRRAPGDRSSSLEGPSQSLTSIHPQPRWYLLLPSAQGAAVAHAVPLVSYY